jgi:hypothetical protein
MSGTYQQQLNTTTTDIKKRHDQNIVIDEWEDEIEDTNTQRRSSFQSIEKSARNRIDLLPINTIEATTKSVVNEQLDRTLNTV